MQDLSLEKSRWSPGGRKLNSGISRRYVSRYSTEDPERKNGADCQVEISSPFHGVAALHVEGSSLAAPRCSLTSSLFPPSHITAATQRNFSKSVNSYH